MDKVPVILFGDNIAAYGVIRALGPKNIPMYLVSPAGKEISVHSRYVKKILVANPIDESFIFQLMPWIRNNVGTEAVCMIAGEDYYLDKLSQNYEIFDRNLKPTFPSWDIVKKVRCKRLTYEIAEAAGVPIPRTFFITSKSELNNIINNTKLHFPLLMKAEDSKKFAKQYKTKGIISNNIDELLDNYTRYNGFMEELLLQEMIPGGEDKLYCLKTVLNKNSDPLAVFVDKKIRSSAQFAACTLTASTWSEEVVQYGIRLLKDIGYLGYASVEFKLDDRDGIFKLMEINGRVSMNNSHALACGINLPHLMYRDVITGPLPCIESFKRNYPEQIVWWHALGELNLIKNRRLTLLEYLKPLSGKELLIEPLSLRDIKPFAYELVSKFASLNRLIQRRLKN